MLVPLSYRWGFHSCGTWLHPNLDWAPIWQPVAHNVMQWQGPQVECPWPPGSTTEPLPAPHLSLLHHHRYAAISLLWILLNNVTWSTILLIVLRTFIPQEIITNLVTSPEHYTTDWIAGTLMTWPWLYPNPSTLPALDFWRVTWLLLSQKQRNLLHSLLFGWLETKNQRSLMAPQESS